MIEKFYEIDGEFAKIVLSKEIYPIVVVKKTLANYLSECFIKIDVEKNDIILYLKNNKPIDIEKTVLDLYNELLFELIRYDISIETKNIRELLIGRALYSTCIDVEKDNVINEDTRDYNIDEIATNWFDKYGDEE